MDTLKKIFPFSFGIADVTKLIINIIIYIVAGAVGGLLIGLLAGIPIVGWLFATIGGLIDLYVVIGIVLAVLDYLKIIK